ncbi:hypothetical protein JOC34_000463 [Virgibacillus halotolerans]|uniref:hypothetical protein n=1 Tax=Virgibacillus halotolerans TaxID=1071053 RepID=UPI00195FB055|nr:hypothetical protein [Virgibacillus halotolerans]MBM7598106.1 hypothetical protein [Virgibacillus halotolerans]
MAEVEVKMNDGIIKNLTIDNYDAEEIAERLNDSKHNMIALGSGSRAVVVQRYSIVRITPVELKDEDQNEDEDGE